MNIIDAANFFIAKSISENDTQMTPLKLQKLTYYTKAWHLVWYDKEIFSDSFKAWVHGPANHKLYEYFAKQGYYKDDVVDKLSSIFSEDFIEEEYIETLNTIYDFYGKYSGRALEDMTHNEAPWKNARNGLHENEKGNVVITNDKMIEYYSSLI